MTFFSLLGQINGIACFFYGCVITLSKNGGPLKSWTTCECVEFFRFCELLLHECLGRDFTEDSKMYLTLVKDFGVRMFSYLESCCMLL